MTKRVNRQVILVKVEATYKVDPTPVASTDAVLVENLKVVPTNLRMVERPAISASLATKQSIYGGALYQITFDAEIKGSGTAGTAPEIGQSLRGCGLDETIVASTSVTYAPISTGFESVTIWRYLDGELEKFSGCFGTVTFNGEVGNKGMFSFSFIGHKMAHTDTALATPTYDSTVPVPIINGAFSIGGYSAVINALTFDLGSTIATPPDWNSANGFSAVAITKRNIVGSIDPERVAIATNDFYADLEASTGMALDTGAIGPTAGNKWRIQGPSVSYKNIDEGDRDGVAIYNTPIQFGESAGDDEISIAFT